MSSERAERYSELPRSYHVFKWRVLLAFSGFYLFEERRDGDLIGPEIIRSVEKVVPIHRGSAIDDFPASDGVLSPDLEAEEIGYQAMPLYMYNFHSDHIVTCETPSQLDLEQRIAAHLAALDTALEYYA